MCSPVQKLHAVPQDDLGGVLGLPDPRSVFDGLDTPAERIVRLVREAFAIYERGAPQLRAIRNERDVHRITSR